MPQPKSPASPRRRAKKPKKEFTAHTDDAFFNRFPDEDAARDWLASTYWPYGVRCPECWCCNVTDLGCGLNPTYRCGACGKEFSIVTSTLMDGSDIPLRHWLYGMFVFTGSPCIPSPRKLAERVTGDDEAARELAYRLLRAAAEPVVRLREPAELDWTYLHHPETEGTSGKSLALALVGRRSHRVAGLRVILTERKRNVQDFVSEHLVEGMMLCADDHRSNRNIPGVVKYLIKHSKGRFAQGPACTNRVEGLWPRLKRVLYTDYSWYSDRRLTPWLDGVKWLENHRHLPHMDRMERLAKGMRWKDPLPRIQDRFLIQRTLGQRHNPPCKDCRNAACLAKLKRPFGSNRIPRANPYQARRAV